MSLKEREHLHRLVQATKKLGPVRPLTEAEFEAEYEQQQHQARISNTGGTPYPSVRTSP